MQTLKPLVCRFSTDRLRFYLWRASKTGFKERGFRCSIYPFRQALGDHIQWVVSCSSASHEIVFRFLVIVAREEVSCKRVRHPKVLSRRTILACCNNGKAEGNPQIHNKGYLMNRQMAREMLVLRCRVVPLRVGCVKHVTVPRAMAPDDVGVKVVSDRSSFVSLTASRVA